MNNNRFDFGTSPITGVNLIDASAGTGKTFTLEGIYLRMILESDIKTENILVVTYTEAATNELRDRILSKLRNSYSILTTQTLNKEQKEDAFFLYLWERFDSADQPFLAKTRENLKYAVDAFDESQIFTIHGFCHRILTDYSFESGGVFNTEILPNPAHIIEEVVQDYWRSIFYQSKYRSASLLYPEFSTPEKLLKLNQKIASQLDIKLEPTLENGDIQSWLEKVDDRFLAIQEMWPDCREAVGEIIGDESVLYKQSYNKNKVDGRLAAVDGLVKNYFYDQKTLEPFKISFLESKVKKGCDIPQHRFFELFELLDNDLQNLILCLKIDFLEQFPIHLKERLSALDLRSYDDLLLDLRNALNGPSADKLIKKIRSKHKVALIDEFQDTDTIQYEIFRKIFMEGHQPVFYIGDPKQSIYQFRGADIFTYCQAKRQIRDSKDSHNYHLGTNYRSDQNLVEAINYIFSAKDDPFLNSEIGFMPSSASHTESRLMQDGKAVPSFQLWFLKAEKRGPYLVGEATQRIVDACAMEVANLLDRSKQLLIEEKSVFRPVKAQDICILVRTHRQAEQMQKALNAVDVPNVLKTKSTIFQSSEYKDLLTLLAAVADYKSISMVKSALVTDLNGYSGDQLYELMQNDPAWEKIIESFHSYHQFWVKSGMFSMINRLMREQNTRARYFRFENGERRLTNLLHAIEVLHKAEINQKLSISGLIKWGKRSILDPPKTDEEEIRLESDENSVKIMTIHNSKGLEFPIVFCPFSWKANSDSDVIFHREDQLVFDLGSKNLATNKLQAKKESLAESIRLLYVALTRARQKCYLVWGDINKTDDSPLTYLFHDGALKFKDEKNKKERKNLWFEMEGFCDKSNGLIQLAELPTELKATYVPEEVVRTELQNKQFSGIINLTRKLSSYSSLTKKIEGDRGEKDYDAITPHKEPMREEDDIADRFKLAKGAKTGVFFHEILEEMDFETADEVLTDELIRQKMKKYAIEEDQFPTVKSMISETLQTDLGFGMALNQLPWNRRVSEMEFHFPIQEGRANRLIKVMKQLPPAEETRDLINTLEGLEFDVTRGFMKGYIDLVFSYNDRYYILDWKTNHLGNRFEAYQPDKLAVYINRHSYNLQYFIYSLALHKYLGTRIPGYSYAKHFGGICYLFLRGISHELNTGVYYNELKNSEVVLNQLDQFFGNSDRP